MRVNLVVVGDPSWQLTHDGFGIWSRTDADIVALDRANEGFSHSVALWTFERRRPRFEPDVAGEAAGVAGDVAAAVIRKPFDRDGQAIDLAEPVLDGGIRRSQFDPPIARSLCDSGVTWAVPISKNRAP